MRKLLFKIGIWVLKNAKYKIEHQPIEIEIQPVGLNEITRYDIVAKGVNGGFLGYCKSESQALSWVESFKRVLLKVKQSATIK